MPLIRPFFKVPTRLSRKVMACLSAGWSAPSTGGPRTVTIFDSAEFRWHRNKGESALPLARCTSAPRMDPPFAFVLRASFVFFFCFTSASRSLPFGGGGGESCVYYVSFLPLPSALPFALRICICVVCVYACVCPARSTSVKCVSALRFRNFELYN